MSNETLNAEQTRKVERMERLANSLDSKFSIMGIKFGWDSLLGFIPGVGDVLTAIPGGIIIIESFRAGVRKRVLFRMAVNSVIDFAIGGIPLIGDIFDVWFKCNKRNVALMKKEISRA